MKKVLLILGFNFFILILSSQPIISTVAGNGTAGSGGDGGAATSANLNSPQGVAIDASGNIYIADALNNKIRKVNASGIITTYAGTGTAGYSGDGGAAISAKLNRPVSLTFDASGNLYIGDHNNSVIRKINASGTISTFAGNGSGGFSGDGGAATSAQISGPVGLAFASGNLYIADKFNNRIRKVNSTGTISTIAGTGTAGYSGDGGPATSAELAYPYSVVVDAAGNIYEADQLSGVIRKINTSGTISTFAGNGTQACTGNGGTPTSANLYNPTGLAIDSYGNIFISDIGCNQIREVNVIGATITAFAGTGTAGYSGDGGAATSAKINFPYGIAFDNSNNLYIADASNSRIRKVTMPYCAASAGPNVSDQNTNCCGCTTTGVQIGTAAITGLSYAWSPNTNLSNLAIAQPTSTWCNSVTPKTYTVTVSGTNCATATSTVTVSTTPYGGVNCCRISADEAENSETSKSKVFPNPSDGNVTITLNEKVDYVQLIDIMGRIIFEKQNVEASQIDVDISKYGKGTYFILINTNGVIEKEKLIVE